MRTRELMCVNRGEAVVDLFCGGGGWTALAEDELGLRVDAAVNHDAVAIEYHAKNYPTCLHLQGDAWETPPASVMAGLRGRGFASVGVLLASAACTTHSRARGSAPVSARVHMLGWCIANYAAVLRPRVVLVENVVEWLDWGPLMDKLDEFGNPVRDAQGRKVRVHDPKRKGREWRRWVKKMQGLGYTVEWRVLEASAFGAASRRKRLFVVCRRDGVAACWPEVMGDGGQNERTTEAGVSTGGVSQARLCYGGERETDGGDCSGVAGRQADSLQHRHGTSKRDQRRVSTDADQWRAAGQAGRSSYARRCAADVIDWSDLGTSLFARKKLLADKTLRRIAEGIRRYVLTAAKPFTLRVTHGEGRGWKVAGIDEPLPTQTTRQDLGVCSSVVQVLRGDVMGRSVTDPLPTITAGNGPGRGAGAAHAIGIGTPVMTPCGGPKREPTPVTQPMHTLLAREDRGVALPLWMNNTTHHTGGAIGSPLPTVTTGGQAGLVAPVGVVLRNHGDGLDVRGPLQTVTSGGTHQGLAAPVMSEYYGNGQPRRVDQPLGTVVTHDRHAVNTAVLTCPGLTPEQLERARQCGALMKRLLGDAVTLNTDGLLVAVVEGVELVLVDILFRMLKPRELARAMGFGEEFILPSVQRHAVRLIGNAVSPIVGLALLRANLPGGGPWKKDGGEREECAA